MNTNEHESDRKTGRRRLFAPGIFGYSCEFVSIRGFLSSKRRHENWPVSDFFPLGKSEANGMKTLSVLVTLGLLFAANQLAARLKHAGALPPHRNAAPAPSPMLASYASPDRNAP